MRKPSFRSFARNPDDAMHSAMQMYARHLDKPPYTVEVHYDDGSIFKDEFQPATKELEYRVYNQDEKYSVSVDTGKFDPDYLVKYGHVNDVPQRKNKIRALFEEWLQSKKLEYKKIIWR